MRTASPLANSPRDASGPRPPSSQGTRNGPHSGDEEGDGVISDFEEEEDEDDESEEDDSDYEGHRSGDESESFSSENHEVVK